MLRFVPVSIFRVARIKTLPAFRCNPFCFPVITRSYSALLDKSFFPHTSKRDYYKLPIRKTSPKMSSNMVEDPIPMIPGVDYDETVTSEQLLEKVRAVLSDWPPLVQREFTTVNGDHHSSGFEVRIMQWNILSQALSTGKDNFVLCPPEALQWNSRRLRLLEEILLYDPHIVCLEEVDHFEFFKSTLKLVGYDGMFFPKPDSPALYVKGSNGPDGCAIFYKTDTLDIVQKQNVVLQDNHNKLTNQVSIFITFKNIPRDDSVKVREFCVAVTHLKAKLGWSQLRFEQGKFLADYLAIVAQNRPLFVCGDFNAEYDEAVYSVFRDSDLALDSAYKALQDGREEPPYTTWKVRGGRGGQQNEVCRTIDYIWFSKHHSQVKALLQLPSEEDVGKGRLPSLTYGSDHLSLIGDFVIV